MPLSKGVVSGDSLNVQDGNTPKNRSTFTPSYNMYNTHRFGEYAPTFVMEGVPTDIHHLQSVDTIRSYTMGSPLMSGVRKKKMLFQVPYMALLPNTWDLIYANPVHGDDVPVDANCVLLQGYNRVSQFLLGLINTVKANLPKADSSEEISPAFLTAALRACILNEYFWSDGSLLNALGYKTSGKLSIFASGSIFGVPFPNILTFDDWFDFVVDAVFARAVEFKVTFYSSPSESQDYIVLGPRSSKNSLPSAQVDPSNQYAIYFRTFLCMARENPNFVISTVVDFAGSSDGNYPAVADQISSVRNLFIASFSAATVGSPSDPSGDNDNLDYGDINLSRLLAYQISIAHYESNDAIDDIYSASLWRNYVWSLVKGTPAFNGSSKLFKWYFSYNGSDNMPYDWLSGRMLASLYLASTGELLSPGFNTLSGVDTANSDYLCVFALWSAIFGYRRSLRYVDYFTGARLRPLAVGDTDVKVDSSKVSVVDITRSIQTQRFLNSINRVGARIENYTKELFGKVPAPDYHNPFYLVGTEEYIFPDETQNTGVSQIEDPNSITSNWRNSSGRYMYDFDVDDAHPCIFIQIVGYDIRRAYTKTIDRFFFHRDRFDMFNPDFQFIGDQPVYKMELGEFGALSEAIPISGNFGYQGRNMEYKQRYDVASGGFVNNLKGWLFLASSPARALSLNLDSDFIRSYPTELDDYYVKLNGYSLGNYWHFIVATENNVNSSRPMAYKPQLL